MIRVIEATPKLKQVHITELAEVTINCDGLNLN